MNLQEKSESNTNKFILFFGKRKTFILAIFAIILLCFFGVSALLLNSYYARKKEAAIPKNAKYMAGEVIVVYKEGFGPNEENHLRLSDQLKELGVINETKIFSSTEKPLKYYYRLSFSTNQNVQQTIDAILSLEGITTASANYVFSVDVIPNDPLYSRQWNLTGIDAEKAWNITKGTNTVTVAIIDSGIDYNHPDFAGRDIKKGKDFSTCALDQVQPDGTIVCLVQKPADDDPMDENGHGTHVAGIVGAATNNRIGVAGVTWQTNLLAVKVMAPNGSGSIADVLQGIEYAINNNAKVINLSLGGPGTCQLFNPLFAFAKQKGIAVVAAVGNKGQELVSDTPAICDNVITVGSIDQSKNRSVFSNWGDKVMIAAPGTDILSLKAQNCRISACFDPQKIVDSNYLIMSGTSMATPHVSGSLALLIERNPDKSISDIKNCLFSGASSITSDLPIGKLLNINESLRICGGVLPSNTPVPTSIPTPTTKPGTPTIPSPTKVVEFPGSCSVSLVSSDQTQQGYNLVNLSYSGTGGYVYLQIGQKGSAKQNGNLFEQNGWFSQNSVKGIGNADLAKKKSTDNIGEKYDSTTVFVSSWFYDNVFTPSLFQIYNWIKAYKKNPTVSTTSTNPSDFIQGTDTAWWYLLDVCDGSKDSCDVKNVKVKIPKDTGAWVFCSVRTVPLDNLVCIGNPICSYNGGPDIGAQSDWACKAWIRSCSESDFIQFDPNITGVNVGSFKPRNIKK